MRREVAWMLCAPNALYDAHAGALLGHRFLRLTHRGRRTGRPRRTVLEVLSWDGPTHEAVVISGLGPRANWLRNVLAAGAAEVEIAGERWTARVRALGPAEGAAVLADYERRNRFALPLVRRILSKLAGFRYDGTEAARRRLVERLPVVAFSPSD
ncbi:MAG TPA: nitroreductase family deazaflavin-dependent oxidoreductase [Solirubrobacter sp.]|nr:nitroreductase family deazaflavin-dependent oxidoreductase [Solirubrobacter sp.]